MGMRGLGFGGGAPVKVFGAPVRATINQAGPGSGTEYPVLAATAGGVRVISAGAQCTWTVQPSPLELRLTVDGNTVTFVQTDPVTLNAYAAQMSSLSQIDAQDMEDIVANADPALTRAFLIEGGTLGITAEITGGTVQNLSAYVIYQVLVDV